MIALPLAFMDGMETEATIVAGARVDLGRVYVGLAVKKGATHPELELVGVVPVELGAYIDTSLAVSARSTQADAAKALIAFLVRPDHSQLWKSKGLERVGQ